MGSSIMLKVEETFNSRSYNWQTSQTNSYCTKVIDAHSHLKAQKYSIDSNILEQQWNIFQLRKRQSAYFVQIFDILNENPSSLCSKQSQLHVIIEQIQYRFTDIVLISFQEGIYILKTIISGYKILQQNNIPFYLLDETNICFNKRGICKFWINENLYLAKPNDNRIISEEYFVEIVLEMVQEKIDLMNQRYMKLKKNIGHLTLQALLNLIYKVQNRHLMHIERLASEKYSKSCKKLKTESHSKDRKSGNKVSIKKFMYDNKKNHQTPRRNIKNNETTHEQIYLTHHQFNLQPQNGYKLSLSSKLKSFDRLNNLIKTTQGPNIYTPRSELPLQNTEKQEYLNPEEAQLQQRQRRNIQKSNIKKMKSYYTHIKY